MPALSDAFLKLRIWLKIAVLALVLIYFLLFLYFNSQQTTLWLFPGTRFETNVIVALLGAFLLGSLLTLLLRMLYTTLTQIRTSQQRTRAARLEREIDEMKAKAASGPTRT